MLQRYMFGLFLPPSSVLFFWQIFSFSLAMISFSIPCHTSPVLGPRSPSPPFLQFFYLFKFFIIFCSSPPLPLPPPANSHFFLGLAQTFRTVGTEFLFTHVTPNPYSLRRRHINVYDITSKPHQVLMIVLYGMRARLTSAVLRWVIISLFESWTLPQ